VHHASSLAASLSCRRGVTPGGNAQAMRAILLANATATTLNGLRARSCVSRDTSPACAARASTPHGLRPGHVGRPHRPRCAPFTTRLPGNGISWPEKHAPKPLIFADVLTCLIGRAENSHQPLRQREQRMKRFKSPGSAQRSLSTHAAVYNVFNIQRHLISRRTLRVFREQAMLTWRQATVAA
jgi:hypothetical protein